MIDTTLSGIARPAPRPSGPAHRLESAFAGDRDADGHYLPGRGKPGEEHAGGGAGTAESERRETDILDLIADGNGAALLLARITAGFLWGLAADAGPGRERPAPHAQRALTERYRQAQAAPERLAGAAGTATPEDAARRIAQAAAAAYAAGTEDSPDRRRLHVKAISLRLAREIGDALRDAPLPAAAEVTAHLARLVHDQLDHFATLAA